MRGVHGDLNGDGWEDMTGLGESTGIWHCLEGEPACTQLPVADGAGILRVRQEGSWASVGHQAGAAGEQSTSGWQTRAGVDQCSVRIREPLGQRAEACKQFAPVYI